MAANMPAAQPGPYGYPLRFAVWEVRGFLSRGLKVYDLNQPFRYIEKRGRRRILHATGRKNNNSPALVSIYENWPAGSPAPARVEETFTITVHAANFSPPLGQHVMIYGMDHIRCRPTTYEFALPFRDPNTGADGVWTFQWRRAPCCHETKGISTRTDLPADATGQRRPPEDTSDWGKRRGYVLIWVNSPHRRQFPPGLPVNQPLGWTKRGEEIVASWAQPIDRTSLFRPRTSWQELLWKPGGPLYYFQFWGTGVGGQLGEVFTHIAVLTAAAIYYDQCFESKKRDAPWLY